MGLEGRCSGPVSSNVCASRVASSARRPTRTSARRSSGRWPRSRRGPRSRRRRWPRSGWRRRPGRRRRARRRRRRSRCAGAAPAHLRREASSARRTGRPRRAGRRARRHEPSAPRARGAPTRRGRCRSGGRASAGHEPCRLRTRRPTSRPELRWKSSSGARRARPEDPVDAAAVETDPGERRLQLADVVAAHVGADEHEQPVTELPRRLDQRPPRLLVATPVDMQAAAALEVGEGALPSTRRKTPPRRRRAGTRRRRGGVAGRGWPRRADRVSAGSCEEFVELLHQLALALGADELLLHVAAWNRSRVGMLITLYRIATSGFSSTLSLVIVT